MTENVLLRFGLILLLSAVLLGGDVPVDSLLSRPDLSILQKTEILPIRLWQNISYSSDHLGCQFEPSCSQFMATAIADHGTIVGTIMGTDRILRCNPAALHYHLKKEAPTFTPDGRIIDPVDLTASAVPAKDPRLAMALSIIPGLGRVYSGHGFDGIISFLLISTLTTTAVVNSENGHSVTAGFTGSLSLLLWSADVYGAWRSAKEVKSKT